MCCLGHARIIFCERLRSLARKAPSENLVRPGKVKSPAAGHKGLSQMNSQYKRAFFAFAIFLTGGCSFLFYFFYNEAKITAIGRLNEEQKIHAKQAAQGIEEFFAMWTRNLNSLSKMDEIISTDTVGKCYLKLFYEANQEEIKSITRLNEKGVIIYNFPQIGSMGTDISSQKHIQDMLRNHKPVISDVFRAVEGFDAVAVHVPVFKGPEFKGTIGLLINFESIAKRYLDVIKFGETGCAWVLSRDGTQLYNPVPGITGKSVLETDKDSPSLIMMANNMLRGHEGAAQYNIQSVQVGKPRTIREYAVYTPVHVGNTFWSIAVVSSEQDVLSGLISFRDKLAIFIGILFICGMLLSTLGAKAWLIFKEEERRKKAEIKLRETEQSAQKLTVDLKEVTSSKDSLEREIAERKRAETALRESEQKYRRLIETASGGIVIGGPDGKMIFVNKKMADMLGYSVEELTGKIGLDFMPADQKDKVLANRRKLSNKNQVQDELCYIRKDGARIWTIGSYSPIVNDSSEHIGNLCMFTDITERKQREEEILRISGELRKSNGELKYFNDIMVDRELRMVEIKKEI